MKFQIPMTKPRNRFVAASLLRKAGSHRPDAGARRRQTQRELRREVESLSRRSP